jgi:hypothetical protein
MRKFWIVMLAAGLMMAFTMPAFGAVGGADVKFSGSYLINGIYGDNPTLKKKDTYTGTSAYAVYDQRLRVQTDFKIAEGLVLVTRFDALEKIWGNQNWLNATASPPQYDSTSRPSIGSAGSNTQENIEFERAYIDFTTGIGRFMVGYQQFTQWGTALADGNNTKPGIKYIVPIGPITLVAALERNSEGQRNAAGTNTIQLNAIDVDSDAYDLGFIYKWTGGEAGLLFQYALSSANRTAAVSPFATKLYVFDPYVKMTFGPVYVEAEGIWLTGKAREFEGVKPATGYGSKDIDADGLGLYIKANVDLKPAYVGAIFVWSQGDDNSDDFKKKGGWLQALAAGSVFEPCLLFGSYWYTHAGTGGQTGFAAAPNTYSYFFDNIWFAQGYVGFKPDAKIDVFASYSWMKADKKPRVGGTSAGAEFTSDAIGSEIDVKVTYKIFDNLSYMIGGAYFFTGDYFKGAVATNQIDNNYLLMHQLNLSF